LLRQHLVPVQQHLVLVVAESDAQPAQVLGHPLVRAMASGS
jgi:hypothetical protein